MASDGTDLALGDQDFQAPEARHTGAGTAGLLELTDLDRSEIDREEQRASQSDQKGRDREGGQLCPQSRTRKVLKDIDTLPVVW